MRSLSWFRQHARNTDGRPYSHDFYPHLGAPGGPCDALDDNHVRRIWLQFGSRLGKTFLGQCATMKKADLEPGPMMFASSVEKVAGEVVERTYQMLEQTPRVAGQLRPKGRRRRHCIDFSACQCFVAWSRSVSTLADKEIEFGHANEIDKWEQPGAASGVSKEADPLKLFLDRFKNRPHHKILLESTPTIKGKSRVETGRLASTNCQYHVPCPHCKQYQVLSMEQMTWEHLPNGKSERDLARRTTVYRCQHCQEQVTDNERILMMRCGVWCPEGCTVKSDIALRIATENISPDSKYVWNGWDNAEWIEGKPLRSGVDAGYRLSSLYATTLTWGDVAAEFVASKPKPQDLRNFINSWLAETWEQSTKKTTWEELGGRIITKTPRYVVPRGYRFLTAGIDRQETHFVYVIDAWGEGRKSHTVDYGECDTFEELYNLVLGRNFAHEDRGASLQVELALIDSGYHPKGIYEFCKKCHGKRPNSIWPCKGSNSALPSPFVQSKLGENTHMPGAPIMHIDTLTTQDWLNHQLLLDHKNAEGAASLFNDSLSNHQDFLEQLLNDVAVIKRGSNNTDKEVWERHDDSIPNDYRDCRRYAYAAMLRVTRGAPIRPR